MYDYGGFNAGDYGEIPTKKMSANDNRKWALDVIAEALMEIDPEVGPTGQPSENAMVIFDESRHVQSNVATDSTTCCISSSFTLLETVLQNLFSLLASLFCLRWCYYERKTPNHGDMYSQLSIMFW